MSITGLIIFMFVSAVVWLAGLLMQGTGRKSKPREFQPTPPMWWERDIETFIRKYWVWIVVFLVWLGLLYVALIYTLALGAASISHLPKPLP